MTSNIRQQSPVPFADLIVLGTQYLVPFSEIVDFADLAALCSSYLQKIIAEDTAAGLIEKLLKAKAENTEIRARVKQYYVNLESNVHSAEDLRIHLFWKRRDDDSLSEELKKNETEIREISASLLRMKMFGLGWMRSYGSDIEDISDWAMLGMIQKYYGMDVFSGSYDEPTDVNITRQMAFDRAEESAKLFIKDYENQDNRMLERDIIFYVGNNGCIEFSLDNDLELERAVKLMRSVLTMSRRQKIRLISKAKHEETRPLFDLISGFARTDGFHVTNETISESMSRYRKNGVSWGRT